MRRCWKSASVQRNSLTRFTVAKRFGLHRTTSAERLSALGKPAEARDSFLAAIASIEALRREVAGGEQQQQSFLENRLSPWFGMIDRARVATEVCRGADVCGTIEGACAARRAAKRSRQPAQVVVQRRTASRGAAAASGWSRSIRNSRTRVRRDKPDVSRVAELKSAVEKARLEYEDFETQLYVTHPELQVATR